MSRQYVPTGAPRHSEPRQSTLDRQRERLGHGGNGPCLSTFLVPTLATRLRVSGRCPHCGGSLFEARLPRVAFAERRIALKGTVVCLLCGRGCAQLAIGGAS